MPDNDIPVILAVADSLALSGIISDAQRTAALEAIASFRALSPTFLENAERIIAKGTDSKDTWTDELFSTSVTGTQVSTALRTVLSALWALQDIAIAQRMPGSAVMGKEVTKNA